MTVVTVYIDGHHEILDGAEFRRKLRQLVLEQIGPPQVLITFDVTEV